MIKFLKNKEIDKKKWDNCLENSSCPKMYAYSWYLDIISPNWGGLIEDDYVSIFPLPIKHRLCVSYISQPLFAQQLGLFSCNGSVNFEDFVSHIPIKIWLRSLQVHNKLTNTRKKDNFELDISIDIEKIRKRYSQNTKRNIKKARQQKLIVKECSIQSLIQLFKRNKGKDVKEMNEKSYSILERLLIKIKEKKIGDCYGIFNAQELISGAFLSNCFKRSIYLFAASNTYAKKIGANHLLIDTYIEESKRDSLILDFEGSVIPSLARFYASFGASKKTYYIIERRIWK